ncbi:ras-related protein Rab-7L1-like [Periplaneta americana]|uniref:ras-related protein Rab-7L1-like n=1 Tax=Periplaneta americana TaxID=6978 RepID=UPI0037E7FD89
MEFALGSNAANRPENDSEKSSFSEGETEFSDVDLTINGSTMAEPEAGTSRQSYSASGIRQRQLQRNLEREAHTSRSNFENVPETTKKREYIFKVLLFGVAGVGKTSIIKRYIYNYFLPENGDDIPGQYSVKVEVLDHDRIALIQIWDSTAERGDDSDASLYYKMASGAVAVFDITNPGTLKELDRLKKEMDENVTFRGRPIPCVLLANKCDLLDVDIDKKMKDQCKKKGYINWFKTSVVESINIQEAFGYLLDEMVKKEEEPIDNVDQNETFLSRCCSCSLC